jgi:hypothetical protein
MHIRALGPARVDEQRRRSRHFRQANAYPLPQHGDVADRWSRERRQRRIPHGRHLASRRASIQPRAIGVTGNDQPHRFTRDRVSQGVGSQRHEHRKVEDRAKPTHARGRRVTAGTISLEDRTSAFGRCDTRIASGVSFEVELYRRGVERDRAAAARVGLQGRRVNACTCTLRLELVMVERGIEAAERARCTNAKPDPTLRENRCAQNALPTVANAPDAIGFTSKW